MSGQYDRLLTLFSPEGKLYQIEYAFKAIRIPAHTTIGVRGKDSVALITQKKVPDKLFVAESVTHMHKITDNIGVCMTGRRPDSKALILTARDKASKFKYANGFDIPVKYLAEQMADHNQFYTQHAYKRVPAATMMLCAIDEEVGPRLYLVDPAGHFLGYKAVASGQKEQDAMNTLEKMLKDKIDNLSYQETVEAAIEALQKVIGVDFKSNEVEISVVTKDNPKFRLLSQDEIDGFLTAITERD